MTVEANFDLYSCAQGGKTTDNYYKILLSTVGTINANKRSVGLHPSVFKTYFQPMKDRGVEDLGKELTALTSDELKEINEAATLNAKQAAQGGYMTCLFLLLADDENERYGPLNVSNNFNLSHFIFI